MSDLQLFTTPRRKTNRTRGRALHVELARNSALLFGPHLVGLIEGAQISARQWNPSRRTWMVSRFRVDDLIAYAEEIEGRVVTLEDSA